MALAWLEIGNVDTTMTASFVVAVGAGDVLCPGQAQQDLILVLV
jgi:hypothetical protein